MTRPEANPPPRHPYHPLEEADLEKIHGASMEVLAEVGFEVHAPEALELFRRAGARVDSATLRVFLPESAVIEILATAPSEVTLHGREPGHEMTLGTGRVYCGTGGLALNVLDYGTGRRRPARLPDLVDLIRLVDRLDNIHCMLLPTYPNELPVEVVDLNRFFAGLAHTSKHVMGGVFTSQGIHDVVRMAEEVAGSPEALRERPFISMIACGISPLRLDEKYGSFMIQVAREGIPLAAPAEPLAGATAPATLAGTLVIQNCDALINVMVAQLANPGAPVLYGCVASTADLRDLKYLGASVESGLLNAGAAQLARRYGIPYYGTAGISDAKTLDTQCGYDSALTNMLVALAGGDFIHDSAGLMEFALTVSPEKLVIDDEIIGSVLRARRGIEVDEETLARDVIGKAGPGGNFISARHTRRHMHRETFVPTLANREYREVWEAAGSPTLAEVAHERVEQLRSEPARSYLEPDRAEAIRRRFPAIEAGRHEEVVAP
jgi:trimethylamine--corrinoid protein Co-methyltransferase